MCVDGGGSYLIEMEGRGRGRGKGKRVGKTYEFIIRLHTSQDQALAVGGPERRPFFSVLGIDVVGEVLGPVDACGFGVADVGYVVDVALVWVLLDIVDGGCWGLVVVDVYPWGEIRWGFVMEILGDLCIPFF